MVINFHGSSCMKQVRNLLMAIWNCDIIVYHWIIFATSFALEHVSSQPLMLFYCKYSSPVAIFCPEPVSPRNGDFVYDTPSHMPHPGSIILYKCEFGYSLVGDSMLTCHIDGNWSAPMPTCEEGSDLPACMLKFGLQYNSCGEWYVVCTVFLPNLELNLHSSAHLSWRKLTLPQ